MAGDLEKLAVDIERPIGCISRTVFWILFVVFGVILGAIGWLMYTVFWSGSTHIVLGSAQHSENNKDALIVGLVVVVLAMALAAIIRDSMRKAIYRRVLSRRNKS